MTPKSPDPFPVVELSGGLGNQLFQYAFSRKLMLETNSHPVLSLEGFKSTQKKKRRKCEITRLALSEFDYYKGIGPIGNLFPFLHSSRKVEWDYNLSNLTCIPETKPFNAKSINFSEKGYYKSSLVSLQYWKDIYEETTSLISDALLDYKSRTRHSISIDIRKVVGIHIRRGDYLSDAKTRGFHGYCSDSFYLDAMDVLFSQFDDIEKIMIFTDDVKSCNNLAKQLRIFDCPVVFCELTDSISVLIQMSECSYLVGSNSTFSWWAAHIGERKTCVFPSKWFIKISDYEVSSFFNVPSIFLDHSLMT